MTSSLLTSRSLEPVYTVPALQTTTVGKFSTRWVTLTSVVSFATLAGLAAYSVDSGNAAAFAVFSILAIWRVVLLGNVWVKRGNSRKSQTTNGKALRAAPIVATAFLLGSLTIAVAFWLTVAVWLSTPLAAVAVFMLIARVVGTSAAVSAAHKMFRGAVRVR